MARSLTPFVPHPALAAALLLAGLGTGCESTSSTGLSFHAQSVALVDLTGDGRLDVVGADAAWPSDQSFLSSRLQAGTSPVTFQAPVRTLTGLDPVAIAMGDLDGDGLPDVAVADNAQQNGDHFVDLQFQVPGAPGSFSGPTRIALGSLAPRDVVLADLLGSGRLDVVIAAGGAAAVQVAFHGPTPGTFGPVTSFPAGGEPTAVAAADLTGSGRIDLVVANAEGQVSVLLHGASAGTFEPPVSYGAGASPAGVQVADVNGDGRPDVLVADYSGWLHVLLQAPAGDGTLLPTVRYSTQDYGSCSVAAADLDGDGTIDVVVANAGPVGLPGSVAVFLQDPATPGVLLPATMYQGYWGPMWVVIGDVDRDGRPDLVIADGYPSIRYQSAITPGFFLPPVFLKQ